MQSVAVGVESTRRDGGEIRGHTQCKDHAVNVLLG